jgi:TPR repeat protein
MKTRRVLIVVMLLLASIPPLWADDLSTAIRQLKEHAAQGDAEAQVNLGLLYSNGQGVPQDYVEAHKWFNLAAANADLPVIRDLAATKRNSLATQMTPVQIAEAQKLARE